MTIRNRVVGVEKVKASDLRANPKNWRKHPPQQRAALSRLLDEVGDVGILTAVRGADGVLTLLDGHLRAGLRRDDVVDVAVLDLNEREADLVLATYDPLAAMAVADMEGLTALLRPFDAPLKAWVFDIYPPPSAPTVQPKPEPITEQTEGLRTLTIQVPIIHLTVIRSRIFAILAEYDA